MATQDNYPGKYNRRVELLKPVTVENDYNEAKTSWVVAYSNYPAKRFEQATADSEKEEKSVVAGTIQIKWDIRYIPKLGIKTDWKIRDIFEDQIYNLVAPPTEIGSRAGILLITEIVQ